MEAFESHFQKYPAGGSNFFSAKKRNVERIRGYKSLQRGYLRGLGLIVERFLDYTNATLMTFAHLAWDKYALPALAVLWKRLRRPPSVHATAVELLGLTYGEVRSVQRIELPLAVSIVADDRNWQLAFDIGAAT